MQPRDAVVHGKGNEGNDNPEQREQHPLGPKEPRGAARHRQQQPEEPVRGRMCVRVSVGVGVGRARALRARHVEADAARVWCDVKSLRHGISMGQLHEHKWRVWSNNKRLQPMVHDAGSGGHVRVSRH